MNTTEIEKTDSYFKEQMKKAFFHGINFKKSSDSEGKDVDLSNASDENLSFSEWFHKNYGNFDDNYGWFKVENGCAVKNINPPLD